jgi:hypothetical protein
VVLLDFTKKTAPDDRGSMLMTDIQPAVTIYSFPGGVPGTAISGKSLKMHANPIKPVD